MKENTKQNFIEVAMPYGVQKVIVQGPFDSGPIPVEDLFQLLSDKTKKKIETELRLCYIDANTCDYPILPQFFLAIYMKLKKIKYLTVLYKELISNSPLAQKLGFHREENGIIVVPSYQNLWLFIKKRLNPNKMDELSIIILKEINERTKLYDINFGSRVAHDGVVIRSHDKGAIYNKHYDTSMYKGEIGSDLETLIPIHGCATQGTDYDGNFAVPFAEKLDRIERKERIGYFDGHYSSLRNFAVLNHIHAIKTAINVPKSQRRIAKTGTLKIINKMYQKLYGKMDFIVNGDISTKLNLLLKHGKVDVVGYYYRNIHVKNYKKNMENYGQRSLEETINNSIKNGLVDIENASNSSGLKNRNHHVKLCVLSVQIVALVKLQHGITEGLTSVRDIAC